MFGIEKIKKLIQEARESGANYQTLTELRQLLISSGYHPTKKRPSKIYRKTKRLQQKNSRRNNRNSLKGQSCRKGQYYTKG